MGQNETEERDALYREETHGREGQVRRATKRDYGKIKARFGRYWELVAEEPKMVEAAKLYV